MDGLFSLIWVAFIVIAIVNSSNKKKQKQQKRPVMPTVPNPAEHIPLEQFEKVLTESMPPKPAEPMLPPAPVRKPAVATPRVHTHLAPDCDIDGPSGSMDFTSTEGVDPCHDDDLPSRRAPRPGIPVPQEQPGLALEWTGDALVRSVIMQEILTRPSQRQRR